MRVLTISNLFPRPDQPQRGLYNAQLFGAMAERLKGSDRSASPDSFSSLRQVSLVPEWRLWRWGGIRRLAAGAPAASCFSTVYQPVFYIPLFGRSLGHWTYAWTMRGLREEIQWADVVYASWLYPDGVVAARLARRFGRRAWIMVLGSDTFHLRHAGRRRRIRAAAGEAEGFVCVWRGLADRLRTAGIAPDKLHVVPNGVDRAVFHFRTVAEATAELEAIHGPWWGKTRVETGSPRPRLVLFVGNLEPVKGADIMVRTFTELAKRSATRDLLLMIGDGSLRPSLEREASAAGLADRIRLLGRRPHAEVARWMNVADALCLTSRSEGMPNVVIEALASGCPVVAADVGACGELLKDEPACACVAVSGGGPETASATGPFEGLAAALQDVLARPADREALARRNGERFSWDRMAGHILKLMAAGGDGP